jgi:hypothetical protein
VLLLDIFSWCAVVPPERACSRTCCAAWWRGGSKASLMLSAVCVNMEMVTRRMLGKKLGEVGLPWLFTRMCVGQNGTNEPPTAQRNVHIPPLRLCDTKMIRTSNY